MGKLLTTCIAAAALIAAPTAQADPATDAEFCLWLDVQGFPTDCTTAAVMALGQCNHFATGRTWQDAVDTTERITGNSTFASAMLSGAVIYYCPEFRDRLPV